MEDYRIVVCASFKQEKNYQWLSESLTTILAEINRELPEENKKRFVITVPDKANRDAQEARLAYIDKIKAADLVVIMQKPGGDMDDSVGYEMAIAEHFEKNIVILN